MRGHRWGATMAFLMLVVVIVYGDCKKNSPSAMARMPVRVRFAIVGKVGEEFVLQNAPREVCTQKYLALRESYPEKRFSTIFST